MRYTHRLKMLLQSHLVGQASRLSKVAANFSLRHLITQAKACGYLFFLLTLFFVTPAFAVATVTDVVGPITGQGILPNSPATALLRVQVTFAVGDTVTSIETKIIDAGGLVSGDISRLSIYEDNDGLGIFSSADSEIPSTVQTNPVPGTSYVLGGFSSDHFAAPGNIWYYFVVIKTSGSISHAAAFQGWLGAVTGGLGGTSGAFSNTTYGPVRCECKVVDIYYTESDTDLFHTHTWDLVANAYETYWKPNYLSYAIAQEMTEPTKIYSLSESRRYSFLDGTADDMDIKAAHSNALKFERRRKLMGMDTPTAVLGVKVAGKNQFQDATYYDSDYFATMVIKFTDTNTANFKAGDGSGTGGQLQSINSTNPALSGVAVYKNNAPFGTFGSEDTVLNILNTSGSGTASGWSSDGQTLTLTFSPPADNLNAVIPQDFDADLDDSTGQDTHDTTGVDFFVVLRGNPDNIAYGADFTAQVTGMDFVGADNPPASTDWYETGEIKAVFELSDYTGTRVDPGATFPVMGINVNKGDAASESLLSSTFYLKKTGTNFDPNTDLTASGVSVSDRTTGDTVEVTFSTPVWSSVSPTWAVSGEQWWETTVTLIGPTPLPSDDIGVDSGPEYFVNLTTSDTFGYNKKIIAAIPDEKFIFSSGKKNALGTALITNANVDHGSNSRSYPVITPLAPVYNPILGNPSVVFSSINNTVNKNSTPTEIIGIALASNTSPDTPIELKSLVVQIVDTGGNFTLDDLAAMDTDSAKSGIGLYDSAHNPIELAFPPTDDITVTGEGYQRYLLVLKDPLLLPDDTAVSDTIFVTLKTSSTMSSTDAIRLRIWGSEITPCSSYGLGFRAKDDSATDTEARVYGVTYRTSKTVTLDTALDTLGGSSDYSQNWYMVITAGGPDALGQFYKVIGVDNSTPSAPVVTVEGTDLNDIGSVTAVKFFKVESTSYQNFSAPVDCSGLAQPALTIVRPPSGGETAVQPNYDITYNATYSDGITPSLSLYYDINGSGADGALITTLAPPSGGSGIERTYAWDISGVPAGTYFIYGILNDNVNPAVTAYSAGTVTIPNTNPAVVITSLNATVKTTTSGGVFVFDQTGGDLTVNYRATGGAEPTSFYLSNDTSRDTNGGDALLGTSTGTGDQTFTKNLSGQASGTYYLFAVRPSGSSAPSGVSSYVQLIANGKPDITLTAPSGATPVHPTNNQVVINFTNTDKEGNALINLYYSLNNVLNGSEPLIVSGLASSTTTYTWNTAGATPNTYYVIGKISDAYWADTSIAPNRVQVTNPATYTIVATPSLTTSGQGILRQVETGLFGLNASSTNSAKLTGFVLKVTVTPPTGQVLDLTGADTKPIVTLREDTGADSSGFFDPSDIPIGVTNTWVKIDDTHYVDTVLLSTPNTLPADDLTTNSGNDYFLAFNLPATWPSGATFTTTLQDVRLTDSTGNSPYINARDVATNALTVEMAVTAIWPKLTGLTYSIPEEMAEPGLTYYIGDATLTDTYYSDTDVVNKFTTRDKRVLSLGAQNGMLAIALAGPAGHQQTATTYKSATIKSIKLTFAEKTGGFDPSLHLADLSASDLASRGVVVWLDKDTGTTDTGVFNPLTDQSLSATGVYGTNGTNSTLTLTFENAVIPIGADGLPDFFVSVCPKTTGIPYGASFKLVINDGDITLGLAPEADLLTDNLSLDTSQTAAANLIFVLADLTPRYLDPLSDSQVPVLGINLADGPALNTTLDHLKVYVKGATLTATDLLPVGGTNGGLQLYQDNKSSGAIGNFDSGDTALSLRNYDWQAEPDEGGQKVFSVILQPSAGLTLPADDLTTNRGDDYFVTLKLSSLADNHEDIQVVVKDGSDGLVFSTGNSAVDAGLTTDSDPRELTSPGDDSISVNAPTFLSNISDGTVFKGGIVGVFKIETRKPVGGSLNLRNLIVQVVPGAGFNLADLNNLDNTSNSGLTIWKDNGDGVFDSSSDTFLSLSSVENLSISEESYYRYRLNLATAQALSDGTISDSVFFVAVRISSSMATNDAFSLRLWGSNMDTISPLSYRTFAFGYDTDTANPLDSRSFKKITASLVCSGPYSLNITKPSSPGETPIAGQYKIEYDADVDTALYPLTKVALYYVKDSDYPDTHVLIASGLSVGFGKTYDWNTNSPMMPPDTYYIYGELGSGVDTDTAFAPGTVTIGNSPPIVTGSLTITPTTINIGDTASISLSGLTDADSNILTVTFYSTDAAGADTRIAGIRTVSAPYPTDLTVSWSTAYTPAMPVGPRLLYAEISDGANPAVVFPTPPNGTPFTMQAPVATTGSAISQVISGQGILPNSPPTAILGLNLTSTTGDPLNSVTVTFDGVDGFSASDLAGVYLYRNNSSVNQVFDSGDSLMGTALAPSGSTYTIPIVGWSLPKDDAEGNAGIDYFIVVRTSDAIDHYDAFYATSTLINGNSITGVSTVSSGTVRCECKVVDVYYTHSYRFDWLTPNLVPDLWNRYWRPNYIPYSIRTEMTEPNEADLAGTPHAWYLTELGNYRYSYVTGGPSTPDEYTDYTYAFSNLLKFERKRQLLQMQVPTAILGIKVAGKNQFQATDSGYYDNDYLKTLVIDFTDTDSANFNARDMLFPLNTLDDAQSGVALYLDNNHNGILDEGDTVVDLDNNVNRLQWDSTGNRATFNFLGIDGSLRTSIPQTYDAGSGGDSTSYVPTYLHDRIGTDFLVVIRARPQTTLDSKIKYGADFTAEVTTLTTTGGTAPLSSISRGQWYPTKEIKAVLELSDYTGSRVDPNSTFPVIGINVVDGPGLYEKIYKITFQIKAETGFDPNIDISGVPIYQDDGSEAGIFDPKDTILAGLTRSDWKLVVTPTGNWWETIISAVPGLDVPDTDTDTGLYQGDDYYVVLQTSENFGYLDKITCRILDGGIEFSGTTKSTLGTGLVTNALLPPVSNTRVHWDPFASPETPLPGNVAVKFHDLIITPFLEADPDHPAAILGLELSSNTVSDTQPVLKSLVVQLINRTTDKNYFDMNDLSAMTTDSNTSGLGLWKDNGDGVFDAGVDEALTMAAPPTQYAGTGAENYQRFIIVLDEAQSVDKSFSSSGYPDYFVTIKAKDENASDQLLMRLWGSEMKPPASYGLGFRVSDDNVTDTEAVTYSVTAKTTTPVSTLTLDRDLGGNQLDYNQNWYLVVTGAADTAKGAVKKILGYDSVTKTITCEDLTGLGIITQIRVFKLDSTSYQNHSVDVAFKRKSSVTLSASSTTTRIILTWVDDTPGGGARTFDIERRVKGSVPVAPWTKMESDLSSASPKLKVVGTNTYQYIDVPPGTITYEYRVTVKQSGAADVFSNIVSAKLATYFLYRPTDLHYSVGINTVDLDWYWQDGYKINESGFMIERKGKNEPEASFSVIGSTSQYPLDNFGRYTDQSITDTMLEIEDTYDYRVRAFKGGTETDTSGVIYSDYSDLIEVEVLPSSIIPSGGGGGGGGAVGPLALGISALLGWWKRRRKRVKYNK